MCLDKQIWMWTTLQRLQMSNLRISSCFVAIWYLPLFTKDVHWKSEKSLMIFQKKTTIEDVKIGEKDELIVNGNKIKCIQASREGPKALPWKDPAWPSRTPWDALGCWLGHCWDQNGPKKKELGWDRIDRSAKREVWTRNLLCISVEILVFVGEALVVSPLFVVSASNRLPEQP